MNSNTQTLCYLGVGGNLGNPLSLFDEVIDELSQHPQVERLRESPRYESEPIDSSGPNYVNSVVELLWTGEAEALLKACLDTEAAHGRIRTVQNAPRLIDLDLLLFGQLKLNLPQLCVPHPRMHQRRFVLQPLLDLNPSIIIPDLGPAARFIANTENQWLKALG